MATTQKMFRELTDRQVHPVFSWPNHGSPAAPPACVSINADLASGCVLVLVRDASEGIDAVSFEVPRQHALEIAAALRADITVCMPVGIQDNESGAALIFERNHDVPTMLDVFALMPGSEQVAAEARTATVPLRRVAEIADAFISAAAVAEVALSARRAHR